MHPKILNARELLIAAAVSFALALVITVAAYLLR